jgi:uncharacterized protein (TIGR00290 family)
MNRIVVSWSGGKDSAMMVQRLRADPDIDIVALLTTVSSAFDRVSIHGVRRSILRKQAAALGVPLFEVLLGATSSNDDYERSFSDGLDRVRAAFADVHQIAFGDLFLEDVRGYREALLKRLGWTGRYPLWGEPTPMLAQWFVTQGYQAVLTCVDTTQLDAAFAGRTFDAALLAELPSSVDPCGERGEFHSCVLDGPIFTSPIAVTLGERVRRDERFEYCDLLDDPEQETPLSVP